MKTKNLVGSALFVLSGLIFSIVFGSILAGAGAGLFCACLFFVVTNTHQKI